MRDEACIPIEQSLSWEILDRYSIIVFPTGQHRWAITTISSHYVPLV